MVFVLFLTILTESLIFWHQIKTTRKQRDQDQVTRSGHHVIISVLADTLWKMLILCLGYVTMLSVMTMNVWLLTSALLGSGLGHMFVRPLIKSRFTSVPEQEDVQLKSMADKNAETTESVDIRKNPKCCHFRE